MPEYEPSELNFRFGKVEHPDVHVKLSPNYGSPTEHNVMIFGSTDQLTVGGSYLWSMKPESNFSSHFTIDYDGYIFQNVRAKREARRVRKGVWDNETEINRIGLFIDFVNEGQLTRISQEEFKTWHGAVISPESYVAYSQLEDGFERNFRLSDDGMTGRFDLTSEQIESAIKLGSRLRDEFFIYNVAKMDDISVEEGPLGSSWVNEISTKILGHGNHANPEISFTICDTILVKPIIIEGCLVLDDQKKILPKGTEIRILDRKDDCYLVRTLNTSETGYVSKFDVVEQ